MTINFSQQYLYFPPFFKNTQNLRRMKPSLSLRVGCERQVNILHGSGMSTLIATLHAELLFFVVYLNVLLVKGGHCKGDCIFRLCWGV